MLVKQVYNLETLIRSLENKDNHNFSFAEHEVKEAPWHLESMVYNFELRSPHVIGVNFFVNDNNADCHEEIIDEINNIICGAEFKKILYVTLSEYANSLRSYKKRVKKLK